MPLIDKSIADLQQERAELITRQQKDLKEIPNGEEASMPVELRQKIANQDKRLNDLDFEIDQKEKIEARMKALEEIPPAGVEVQPQVEEARAPEEKKEVEQRAAFYTYIRNPEAVEKRALQTSPSENGGYLVPTTLYNRIIEYKLHASALRQIAEVITTSNAVNIPIEKNEGVARWRGEATTVTEGTSDIFDSKTLGAHSLTYWLRVSQELLQDSQFNLEEYFARRAGRAFAKAEEIAYLTGATNAANTPTGIISQVTQIPAVAAITADSLIDLKESVEVPYQANGAFLVSQGVRAVIRKLKDSNNRYLFDPALIQGNRDMLLGRPLYVSAGMPDNGAGQVVALFGDFSYVMIADRQKTSMIRDPYTQAESGLIKFVFNERTDCALTSTYAIKGLKRSGTASTSS